MNIPRISICILGLWHRWACLGVQQSSPMTYEAYKIQFLCKGFACQLTKRSSHFRAVGTKYASISIRNHSRFFVRVRDETTYASKVEIIIFSLRHVIVRPTKIIKSLLNDYKILNFLVIFLLLKISWILLIFFLWKLTRLGDQILLMKTLIFKILYFLKMCPIFVSSVHNYGNRYGNGILLPKLFWPTMRKNWDH